jgi:MFS family permease
MEGKNNRKELKIFSLASFLNDMGSDIISPVWPLFVTSFTGANMEVLGFIDGLGDAIVSISQAVSGYWSDRIGKRKVFVWVGYLFGASSRIGYALAPVWQWLVPFRVLDRAGKMRGAPRDAMIADSSTDGNRGGSFGFLRTFDNLGAVCGIIISIVFAHLIGYRNLFLIAAIPSIIGATIIFFTIRDRRDPERKIYKGLRLKDIDANFKLFLFLSAVFALGAFSYSFLLIFANRLGFAVYEVPVLYLLFTFVASVFSLPFGRLSDKLKSRKAVVAIAYALWLAGPGLWILFLVLF